MMTKDQKSLPSSGSRLKIRRPPGFLEEWQGTTNPSVTGGDVRQRVLNIVTEDRSKSLRVTTLYPSFSSLERGAR